MNGMPYVVFLIPIVAIAGGFTIAGLGIYAQIRRREFEHRERLAMIEKGVAAPAAVPKTEADGILSTASDVFGREYQEARVRRGGFIVMAVGFGIGFMIWMTGESHAALGIGGFLLILGAGIFLSSYFGRGAHTPPGAPPGGPGRR